LYSNFCFLLISFIPLLVLYLYYWRLILLSLLVVPLLVSSALILCLFLH